MIFQSTCSQREWIITCHGLVFCCILYSHKLSSLHTPAEETSKHLLSLRAMCVTVRIMKDCLCSLAWNEESMRKRGEKVSTKSERRYPSRMTATHSFSMLQQTKSATRPINHTAEMLYLLFVTLQSKQNTSNTRTFISFFVLLIPLSLPVPCPLSHKHNLLTCPELSYPLVLCVHQCHTE